jgi:phosphoribosylformylglycinamidine synthase
MIDPKVYRDMGLSDSEFKSILEILGREPSITEIGMYAVMWSEHCGYKYSRPVLRLFKKYNEDVEAGAVENAGVVDIGDGLGVVMKMESHNHPSAVEPFQGAATGVGGILRDIFTMGARPVASLNSLRFGTLDDPHTRYLFERVVEGIAHYGNCVGVPTIGGEIYFHPCYAGNPLVNAMSAGIVPTDKVASAAAKGVGNPVIYVGSATGRDGIHGATFASVELGPDSESKRPNVQMGDPFQEKLLIEATLEALASGYVVGIQDMGAAGLTCSTCETASKAGNGMIMDVRKVPAREPDMSPYEIMLSESQERMLAIAEKGREEDVRKIFHKWGLSAEVVGEVTGTGRVVILDHGVVVADVPAASLTDGCPTYHLDAAEPDYIKEIQAQGPKLLPAPDSFDDALLSLLGSVSISSKRYVFQQYDQMVQTQTITFPGKSDAATIAVRGTKKAISFTTDCNARYCYLDPYLGAQIAVAEAARNLTCAGATPLAVTDCLNFPNPEKPDNFWVFKTCVQGIADATDEFDTPVISGNVSFYNETPKGGIFPTPTIGMVGLIEDATMVIGYGFVEAGDEIYLISGGVPTWGGSEYLAISQNLEAGVPPTLDLNVEKAVQKLVREAITSGIVKSAHDSADGGIAVALAESAIASGIGANISLMNLASKVDAALELFGERNSTIIVTLDKTRANELIVAAAKVDVPLVKIGEVGGKSLTINASGEKLIDLPVEKLSSVYESAIPAAMEA